jgi:hypothetical protein
MVLPLKGRRKKERKLKGRPCSSNKAFADEESFKAADIYSEDTGREAIGALGETQR